MDFKIRFYDTYENDLSPRDLEDYRITYKHYYGNLLPSDLNSRILEIGCGQGAFLYYLASESYENIEGIDISPEQIKKAKKSGFKNVICGDALNFLTERHEAYDCVVAIDLIDHFPKQQAFELLKAIYHSLRPGGRVVMKALNADGPFAARLRYGDFTHEFALTGSSAQQIMRAAGFTEISISGTDPFVHSLPSLVRVIVWKLIKTLLWVYLVAETGVVQGHILTKNLIALGFKPAV